MVEIVRSVTISLFGTAMDVEDAEAAWARERGRSNRKGI